MLDIFRLRCVFSVAFCICRLQEPGSKMEKIGLRGCNQGLGFLGPFENTREYR
jgi:hypothetical protein